MKIKMLIIAAYPGYEGVLTAGGKTHFYYLSKFSEQYEVRLVTSAYAQDEKKKIQDNADKLGIELILADNSKKVLNDIIDLESHYNPFNRNGRFIRNSYAININKILKKLAKEKYPPDIILMEWTEALLACSHIRKYFPKAVFVASEHDVTFLSKERKYHSSKYFRKIIKYFDFLILKNREVKLLKNIDLVVTQNEKDKSLLLKCGIDETKMFSIAPYFEILYNERSYSNKSNRIVFYGAMARPENYLSALWFIDNVMPDLKDFTFVVVGNNPPDELVKKECGNIVITGFVPRIEPYFSDALCFVAPLVYGAGIKVKVLEALSFGIPVLTNEVGIEGIPAIDGNDYVKCQNARDYIDHIKRLSVDLFYANSIACHGKILVKELYNIENSCQKYIDKLNSMVEGLS